MKPIHHSPINTSANQKLLSSGKHCKMFLKFNKKQKTEVMGYVLDKLILEALMPQESSELHTFKVNL